MNDREIYQFQASLFRSYRIMFKEQRVCPMLSRTLFKIFLSKYIWAMTLFYYRG